MGIMAIPGGNYSAKFGLDLGMEPTVNEYVINVNQSSFGHWSDPLPGRDTSSYAVHSTECFTALTFNTNNINDIKFNVDGTDDLIWAANNKDTFCSSHGRGQDGRGDRDRFIIEWKTGKAWYPEEADKEEVAVTNGHDGETATNGHYEQDTMEDSDSSAASIDFSCLAFVLHSILVGLISF